MNRHQGNRYGRSEEARTKVLHAADDLLAEVGFAAVTVEGLAQRAGVSKQTIYRWWPNKADVLLEALIADAGKRLEVGDAETSFLDARAAVAAHVDFLAHDDAGRVLVALTAHARLDPAFAEQFDEAFQREQRDREAAPLRRMIARGDLATDFDIAVGRATLYGPLYAMTPEQVAVIDIDAYVRTWLRGASASGTTGIGDIP